MPLPIAEKILNISGHEMPRTGFAWAIRLLHKTGYIIGFTAITAIFVTRFSVSALPYLFLIQAVLMMLGMIIFSFLNDFFSTKFLIGLCSFLAAFCLFTSTFFLENSFWFFSFLFLALGIFIPQLTIFHSILVEDFFSPLEGERVFPLIESAQTIGGIFGGLLTAGLSVFFPSYKFMYVWILFLFLTSCVIFFLEPVKTGHHASSHKTDKSFSLFSGVQNFKTHFKKMHAGSFLQTLFVLFLLQWIIGHLLEFQYTKVIEEAISHTISDEAKEGSLAHGLGTFHILFYGSALVVQLLLASRLLKNLGVAGSFLLHAMVTFFSAISLLFGFGYFTLVLAKNNFEISGIMHNNAYEASYYAMRHGTQKSVREFFEAFLYPLGTIIGTLLLLAIQWFFLEKDSFIVIQFCFVFFAVLMIGLSLYLQRSYTQLVTQNFFDEEDQLSKLHSIEILSQKGHHRNADTLLQGLHSKNQSLQVKIKILTTLGKMGNSESIAEILYFCKSREPKLVLAAVKALESFPKLGEQVFTQAFARYRVIHELKQLFLQCKDEQIQTAIIRTLAKLHDQEIVEFLLDVLKNGTPNLKTVCIRVCSLFKDANVAYFLEPYLQSTDAMVKVQSLIALWPFFGYRQRLHSMLQHLLTSNKREEIAAGLLAIGEIGNSAMKKILLPYLVATDPELRLQASHSLLKLGSKEAIDSFVPLLLSKHSAIAKKAHEFLADFTPELQRMVTHALKKEVSQRLYDGVQAHCEPTFLQELLVQLKNIYLRIESYHEADYIERMLENKSLCTQEVVEGLEG